MFEKRDEQKIESGTTRKGGNLGKSSGDARVGRARFTDARASQKLGDVESDGTGTQKNEKTQVPSQWSAVVELIFDDIDSDHDGVISEGEVNEALYNPKFQGAKASAVSALHKWFQKVKRVSNDQLLWERGVTKADIIKYDPNKMPEPEDFFLRSQTKIVTTRKVLFAGRDSPKPEALRQGPIGDCYFLSALVAYINEVGPSKAREMIVDNKDGTYTVRFPGKLGTVTVNAPTDAEIARYSGADDGIWVVVMEKAYAKAKANEPKPDVQKRIGEGGQLKTGLEAFTKSGTDTDFLVRVPLLGTKKDDTRKKLDKAFGKVDGKKRMVTAAIWSENEYNLPKSHAYTVMDWDGEMLTIRNPWGRNPRPNANGKRLRGVGNTNPYDTGKFAMTLDEFYDVFSEICYEE